MAFLAVNPKGTELLFCRKPTRREKNINGQIVRTWYPWANENDTVPNPCIAIPAGSIKELTGRDMTWENDPIRI